MEHRDDLYIVVLWSKSQISLYNIKNCQFLRICDFQANAMPMCLKLRTVVALDLLGQKRALVGVSSCNSEP